MLPAAASAHPITRTLKFISVTKAQAPFASSEGGQQDTDVNSKGKVIGYDELYFATTSKTTAAVNISVDTTGGFLYATFKFNLVTSAITDGKVTGGTGAFAGATGTITAKNVNAAGTRTAVTVTYHT
jgi:hypothetical protein